MSNFIFTSPVDFEVNTSLSISSNFTKNLRNITTSVISPDSRNFVNNSVISVNITSNALVNAHSFIINQPTEVVRLSGRPIKGQMWPRSK